MRKDALRITRLEKITEANGPSFGAKAVSLANMTRLGMPVPPGFCIAGAAYREHLWTLSAGTEIPPSHQGPEASETIGALLSGLRRAIVEAPISKELAGEIESYHEKLGSRSVAVRSSATAEDLPGHSFAGQHGTYFVTSLEDCLRAVKHCWASLWTERAFDYRQRSGFSHMDADMAVIIQELVPADVSGVLFTADPVTGRADRVIIEACFGLGEALVSGQVTPDRIMLTKDGLDVCHYEVAEKGLEIVLSEDGGAQHRPLAPERSGRPSLDEPLARRLTEMAIEIEQAFGHAQDVEWAVHDGKIFVLQARPITTIQAPTERSLAESHTGPPQEAAPVAEPGGPAEESWEDRQIWVNVNTGEILPDVLTPATWSQLSSLANALRDAMFGTLSLEFRDAPLVGLVGGRVYFNLNTLTAAIRCFPGLRKMDLTKVLGGVEGALDSAGTVAIGDEDLPRFNFGPLKLISRTPAVLYWAISHSPQKGRQYVAKVEQRVRRSQALDLAALSDAKLLALLEATKDDMAGFVDAIAFAGTGMFYFNILDKLCRRWLGDGDGSFANRLVTGMGGMASAEAGLALWRLATLAERCPDAREVILSAEDFVDVRDRLAGLESGKEFLDGWDSFMAEHGHHTRGEFELYNARWSELPDYVLHMVQGYLGGMHQVDPVAHHERQAGLSLELAVECRRKLRNPVKRRVFDFYLRGAQQGSVLRENIKSVFVRHWALIRRVLLEMGGRLAHRGVLENPDHIFFLGLEEIEPVWRGMIGAPQGDIGGGPDALGIKSVWQAQVSRHRAEYDRNRMITPPPLVKGRFDPDRGSSSAAASATAIAAALSESSRILTGVAVSPGLVTGPARVILKADADERVLPGEILVAPFTDPGWTPYFLTASAIVMDMGGLLSHGSIVAREYGIPAVVNVGPATKIIKTGQMMEVDGTRGVVKVLG